MNRLAKAAAVEPSPFLTHAGELKKTQPDQAPFLRVWKNPSSKTWEKAESKKLLYIAPVSLEHLRPMSKPLSKVEVREKTRQERAAGLAEYAHREFTKAFLESDSPNYQIVPAPQKGALHLELAIVELNPNSVTAGVTRRAINLVAVPGAEAVIGRTLKGNIAIEGSLRDPEQNQSLYEFADAEHNRSALILSVHDYNPYSASRKIIREWASQLEQVLRTPEGGRVKDSAAFTFWLW